MLLRFDGSLMFEALHFKRRLVISTTRFKSKSTDKCSSCLVITDTAMYRILDCFVQ